MATSMSLVMFIGEMPVGYKGPSLITDITALDSGIYFAVDKVRGHIFGYDTQGNMLFAFGGNGNMDGYFKLPSAIDHMGK